jgi:hypothetical protein
MTASSQVRVVCCCEVREVRVNDVHLCVVMQRMHVTMLTQQCAEASRVQPLGGVHRPDRCCRAAAVPQHIACT